MPPGAWSSHGVRQDAILSLKLVAEVAVAVVLPLVPQDGDGAVVRPVILLELRGGSGEGGQAGEDDLDGTRKLNTEETPVVVRLAELHLSRSAADEADK